MISEHTGLLKPVCFFAKQSPQRAKPQRAFCQKHIKNAQSPHRGGSPHFARIQEPVTARFTVPTLSSNEHVSVSNRLEETEKTERPRRTPSVKTNLSHAVSQFLRGLHGEAKMQGLGGLRGRPAEGRHCPPAPRERPQLSREAAQWVGARAATGRR